MLIVVNIQKVIYIFVETFNNRTMKKQDRVKGVRRSGWGHYKVTIEKYGKLYSAISTDSQAVDDYRDGKVSAAIRLYDEVIRKTTI